MNSEIQQKHQKLSQHPLFAKLKTIEDLKIFMQYHVYAVWDFMSLLKSLQQKMTCTTLPWRPSVYPEKMGRLINEIVLGEESDLDQNGNPASHFNLYLKAMEEIGADTSGIKKFLQDLNFKELPIDIATMIHYHLNLAMNGTVEEVASAFFYGREKLIPAMFTTIVEILEKNKVHCPTLIYYFKRHIELDGEEHGPKALEFLKYLGSDAVKLNVIEVTAIESLSIRNLLWDFIAQKIDEEKNPKAELFN